MDLSDLHGTSGSSESSSTLSVKESTLGQSSTRECARINAKVEEVSHELLFQLNERDELVNAIQLKNRFIGKLVFD